jgi:hypothetical protein
MYRPQNGIRTRDLEVSDTRLSTHGHRLLFGILVLDPSHLLPHVAAALDRGRAHHKSFNLPDREATATFSSSSWLWPCPCAAAGAFPIREMMGTGKLTRTHQFSQSGPTTRSLSRSTDRHFPRWKRDAVGQVPSVKRAIT